MTDKTGRRSANPALLLANAFGAIVYVVLASRSWAIPAERGMNSLAGEPFVWALLALPVLALYLLVNLGWGIMVLRRRGSGGRYLMMAGAIWLVAVVIDFSHH